MDPINRLTPEKLAKVASSATGLIWVHGPSGNVFKGNGVTVDYWNPKQDLQQKDALTRTAARLIEALPYVFGNVKKGAIYRKRLSAALATDATED